MNRLRELREDSDLTLEDIGVKIGATAQAVGRYETGQRHLSDDLIMTFCSLYGVTADYLLGLSNSPRPTVSELDSALLLAYHAAPVEIRGIVDHALAPYKQAGDSRAVS